MAFGVLLDKFPGRIYESPDFVFVVVGLHPAAAPGRRFVAHPATGTAMMVFIRSIPRRVKHVKKWVLLDFALPLKFTKVVRDVATACKTIPGYRKVFPRDYYEATRPLRILSSRG